ncbi:MAG TPA: hypothetical protein VF195_06215 [Actinomycetota bacterium]
MLEIVVSIAIVVAIFGWGIPKFADYGAVRDALSTLTPIEFVTLFAAMVFNLITYWWANQAALPGLGIGKAAVLTPDHDVGREHDPLGWRDRGWSDVLDPGLVGVPRNEHRPVRGCHWPWNIFTKLGLPMLALVLLALDGHLTPAYIAGAVVGAAVIAAAVLLLALVFKSERLAIRIGEGLGRAMSTVRRLLRHPSVTGWGQGAAKFRRDTIAWRSTGGSG